MFSRAAVSDGGLDVGAGERARAGEAGQRAAPAGSARLVAVAGCVLLAISACGGDAGGDADGMAGSRTAGDDGSMAETPVAMEGGALEPTVLPDPYSAERDWGELPPPREWGRVSGVYVDPAGQTIWAFERCGGDNCVGSDDPTVLRFTPDGTLVHAFGGDMFVRPHGMYVDDEGNVWVTDGRLAREQELEASPGAAEKGNQVVKFTPQGDVLMVLGTPGREGEPPDALYQPNDVIVAPNGEILVSEGHSSDGPVGRISRFSADGEYLGGFGEHGAGPGQFRTPHAMAFDSQGRLFVADRGNSRIQIFGPDYELLEEWRQFGRPNDLFIDEGDVIYVLDSESGEERNPGMRRGIYIGSARTGELTAFVPGHETDGPYGTIGEGIAVDDVGNIYVGEVSVEGMTKFVPE